MAIKGLTDRGLAFPEIGIIRKGAPKNDKGWVGKDLTYFRVEFDEQEIKAAELFAKVYGMHPTEINIILPFNEIERMWDAWLEAYSAGRMIGRSDGERVMYLVDTKTGEVIVRDGVKVDNGAPMPHPSNDIAGYNSKNEPIEFKATGRLKVIIPELARAAYVTVKTTSMYDIGNISDQLRAFAEINGGQIAGIPFVLRRRPKKISTPGKNGTRSRMTKWLLSIEADPEWVKAKLIQVKTLALPGNGLALLPELPAHAEPEGDWPTELDDDEIEGEIIGDTEIEPEPEPYGTGETRSEQHASDDPYDQFKMMLAQRDAPTAFWALAKHIGMEQGTASAIANECNRDFTLAFDKLLKQAPPA